MSKRERAIALGAVPVNVDELAKWRIEKRRAGSAGAPELPE